MSFTTSGGPGGSAKKPMSYFFEKGIGCWIWKGAINVSRGLVYGVFSVNGKLVNAHRYVYEKEGFVIPEGLELDHLCRNTLCVRPSHLEPVTHKVNILRGNGASAVNARKVKAVCGHPFTGLYKLRRYCKPCRTKSAREYYRTNAKKILAGQHRRKDALR